MKKTIDLAGSFGFCLDEEKKGIAEHFERMNLFDTIILPNTTSAAGKGPENSARETGFLTDLHLFEGYAWFQKTIEVADEDLNKKVFLTLERTRISYVYVDEQFVGTQNSFCTAHVYELTGYLCKPTHKITIMVSNVDYPVKGGHMTSPDTQTNWNGILGNITLDYYEGVAITHLHNECDYVNHVATLNTTIHSAFSSQYTAVVSSRILHLDDGVITYEEGAPELELTLELQEGVNSLHIPYELGQNAKTWDEFDPYVYEITVTVQNELSGDSKTVLFGLKEFKACKSHFTINGRKTFLRGKHDGMIFPLTGYAPMTIEGWLKVMSTSRSFGINHYRYHTSCPPEAAFIAADLLGIYMEPELPFWGTFTKPGDEGHDEAGQQYLIEEGFRILDAFSNHPSFVMMSMGNELWGSPESINALLGRYKEKYPHILYTQGSNNFQWVPNIQPNDDFFSGVRFTIDRQIRGSYAMCDKPQGHIQTRRPCTDFNYEDAIFPTYNSKQAQADADGMIEIQYGTGVKKVKLEDAQGELIPNIPVLSHEIGQYETYPDFREIKKYTGVLRARNFETFEEHLVQKNMADMDYDFFRASGALAKQCYKDELETALRTKDMAGFQILDIQDFSGQGTALVGMLDAFMENKGLVSAEEWRTFCSETVIQAEFPTYLYHSADTFSANITLSHYGKEPITDTCIHYSFTMTDGTSEEFSFSCQPNTENGVMNLGSITYVLPDLELPDSVTLKLWIPGTGISNQYELWIFPQLYKNDLDESICPVTTTFSEALNAADSNHNVLLLLEPAENPNSIEGTYCTDFWCYPMFKSISDWMKKERPIGTMGLLIREEHPALSDFPTHFFSTPQWWDICMASSSTILDDTSIVPIVQTIDNFERNHRLGLIYELHLTDLDCNIVICSSPLKRLIAEGHIEAAWLYKSLLNYVGLTSVAPSYSCTSEEFCSLFLPDKK